MTEAGPQFVLVVCSANQCRSPFAAAALHEAFARRGVDVPVASSGIRAFAGSPATATTIDVARRQGLDLSQHRSAPFDPAIVAEADLLIGMERAHVREIVASDAQAWPRTFTLKELARRGAATGPRRPDEPFSAWLARVGQGRQARDLLGLSADDDVADPTGAFGTDHAAMADEVTALAEQVAELVSGPAPRPPG